MSGAAASDEVKARAGSPPGGRVTGHTVGGQVVTGAVLFEWLLGEHSLNPRQALQQNLDINAVGGGGTAGKGSGKSDGSNGEVTKLMMDQMAAMHAQHMDAVN